MGKRIDDEKREQAKAIIYLNPDVSEPELAKQVGIGRSTAHYLKKDIIDNEIGTDNFESLRAQKKQEFIEQAWETVQKALKLADKRFSKALDDEEAIESLIDTVRDDDLTQAQKKVLVSRLNGLQMTNIRDIAVALGTIYDKQALASGEPTQITESHKSIQELQKDTEKLLGELKEITG